MTVVVLAKIKPDHDDQGAIMLEFRHIGDFLDLAESFTSRGQTLEILLIEETNHDSSH
jgi:hypothetical protein